jgi:hypothetical protein
MPKHPQYGMKGSKPRAGSPPPEPPPGPAGPLSSAEEARARFEINARLDREYKEKRNRKLSVELMHKEMDLAFARGRLIERELVEKQLSYILVAVRQKILALPPKIGQRFRSVEGINEIVKYARQACHETLKDCANIPNCVEADWMEKLEED